MRFSRRRLIGSILLSVFLASTVGCATKGPSKVAPNFTVPERQTRKATVVSYVGLHPSAAAALAGAIGRAIAAANQKKDPVVTSLNNKCMDAIEQVLASNSKLPYTPRGSVGLFGLGPDSEEASASVFADLKNRFGITAPMTAKLMFSAGFGWKKPLILTVAWEVLSPAGVVEFAVTTEAVSDSAEEVFPDTLDPRYEATLIELARRNAAALVGFLGV